MYNLMLSQSPTSVFNGQLELKQELKLNIFKTLKIKNTWGIFTYLMRQRYHVLVLTQWELHKLYPAAHSFLAALSQHISCYCFKIYVSLSLFNICQQYEYALFIIFLSLWILIKPIARARQTEIRVTFGKRNTTMINALPGSRISLTWKDYCFCLTFGAPTWSL